MRRVSGRRKKVMAVRARTGGQKVEASPVASPRSPVFDRGEPPVVWGPETEDLDLASGDWRLATPRNTTASTTTATTPGSALQPITLRTSAPRWSSHQAANEPSTAPK